MIDDYWLLNVAGFTLCISAKDADRINVWLNDARLSDKFKTIVVQDVHSESNHIIVLDSVNYILHSTIESRKLMQQHEKMLEKEQQENVGYDF